MKNILSILFLFALLASSCSEEQLVKEQSSSSGSLKFIASFEGNESRTYVEKGRLLRWTAGDQISLFVGNTLNRQYQFEGKTGANSGYFSEVNNRFGTGNGLDCHYAVYPYDASIEITDDAEEAIQITATLPAEQSYAENSFGVGANTMVAVTKDKDDTFLNFKNVGGYLKLQLYGDDVTVKTITLKGNAGEKIAGKAVITPSYDGDPTVSMAEDATEIITLDCGEGVKIGTTADEATAFWMVIPPTTFENGFIVIITDTNGHTFTKSTSKQIAVERNVINPMAAFEIKEEAISNNQIWYTSTSKIEPFILYPWTFDTFGANIITHEWDSSTGKGIITFDNDVTIIGNDSFNSCRKMTSITIPNSVTSIEDGAFNSCSSLLFATIPGSVTTIGGNAFAYCSSLQFVSIPNSVISIDGGAFYECSSLSSIKIPDNVTSIGMFAFTGCISLTSITIPKSVNDIGGPLTSGCDLLSSIIVEQGNQVYDSRENCNAIIETASNTLIQGCKNTIIPNSVSNIGVNAFRSITSMKNIVIPNSVSSIDQLAFCDCSSLESITIPKNVVYIGHNAFTSCSALEGIIVENGNSVYDSRENCNAIIETASNTLIQGCENTIIPNGVSTIAGAAFGGCNTLLNITIPESVTCIGYGAFEGCSSLTSIVIANGLTDIGEFAFHGCSSLPNITIPESVTNIGNGAFWGCKSLSRIDIKATAVPTIGPNTFEDCNSDIKLYVPSESLEAYKAADYWKDLNLISNSQ